MPNDPILHLIGLAKKAGRLEIGEEPVGAVCRARQAKLILVAGDAAANTFRRAAHFGEAGNVLWLSLPQSKENLGFTLGRSSVAMLALTDVGFAASIVKKLAAADPEKYAAAAAALDTKAAKALQRQKEQRQHEKNLRQGKRKPWAPPPPTKKEAPAAGKKTAPKSGAPTRKAGPAGRRMSGKIVRTKSVNKAQEPKNRGGFQ